MAWNVGQAVNYLVRHASTSALHQCAKYVRLAIEAGGVSTAGRPISACDYKSFLPKIGFNNIGKVSGRENQLNWTRRSARPGDIAVMDHGVHGHICMYSGSKWISDFVQSNMWVYGGEGTCWIYRYNGQIDGSLMGFIDFNSTGLRYMVSLDNQKDHILLKNLALARYNLLSEIIDSFGNSGIPMNNDIIYENELSQDDSSLSESIVSTGLFWNANPTDIDETMLEAGLTLEDMKSISSGGITGAGVSKGMINLICIFETSHKFGYQMTPKDLNGYDLGDANGHKTYGYGLLFHPTNKKYMDQIKPNWTQQELEALYLVTVKQMAQKVKNWAKGIELNQYQIDALVCACFNFGPGFLNRSICKIIRQSPDNQAIYGIWCHLSDAQAKKYPGLIKRRQTEAAWYFGKN